MVSEFGVGSQCARSADTVGGPIEGRVPRCRLPAQVTGPRERAAPSAKLLMQAAREMHDVGKG